MNTMLVLKNKLDEIISHVVDKHDVFYIDYPLHHNVGDLLIMEGALQLFEYHDIKVKIFQSVEDFNLNVLFENITPNTTIICHGGGNFGDLYTHHQILREKIITSFPNNRIIIMPQTAHFSNEEIKNTSASIFKKHKDLVMFARDSQTFDFFSSITAKSFLMPDTAHFLYGNLSISKKNNKELYFLRKDIEAIDSQDSGFLSSSNYLDWVDLLTNFDILFVKVSRRLSNFFKKSYIFHNMCFFLWRFHSNRIIKRSSLLFSSYNTVVTSRMHGHILSCLLDTHNVIIDNSYGKNSGYYYQWTNPLSYAELKSRG